METKKGRLNNKTNPLILKGKTTKKVNKPAGHPL